MSRRQLLNNQNLSLRCWIDRFRQLLVGRTGSKIKIFRTNGNLMAEFEAFEAKYGTTVAAGDIDEDGVSEIIAGAGPGPDNNGWVRIFKGDGTPIGERFLAYPEELKYGVRPSGINIVK